MFSIRRSMRGSFHCLCSPSVRRGARATRNNSRQVTQMACTRPCVSPGAWDWRKRRREMRREVKKMTLPVYPHSSSPSVLWKTVQNTHTHTHTHTHTLSPLALIPDAWRSTKSREVTQWAHLACHLTLITATHRNFASAICHLTSGETLRVSDSVQEVSLYFSGNGKMIQCV